MLQTCSTLDDVQRTYDWFEEMRSTQPVWLDESSGCWHVFRYADVHHIISDYTVFSSERLTQRVLGRGAAGGQDGFRHGNRLSAADDRDRRNAGSANQRSTAV